MKKVLVTGASGSIGLNVIRYLLSEGKYEITAFDLRNKKAVKRLKRYRNRIKIVYGDIIDSELVEALVKNNDYIIHLAGLIPPMGDFSSLGDVVEYMGTENIIKAIKSSNKDTFLVYASTTSLYDNSLGATALEKVKENSITNYSLNKYKVEKSIKRNLNNYVILRLPLVLSNVNKDAFIYNVKRNLAVEVTTNLDAAYAFVASLNHKNELNKKIFNVGMGEKGRLIYREILRNILKYNGLSFKYFLSRCFLEKNYLSPILLDSDNLDNIIHYRHDTLYNYFRRLKRSGKGRVIQKILALPLLIFKKR